MILEDCPIVGSKERNSRGGLTLTAVKLEFTLLNSGAFRLDILHFPTYVLSSNVCVDRAASFLSTKQNKKMWKSSFPRRFEVQVLI